MNEVNAPAPSHRRAWWVLVVLLFAAIAGLLWVARRETRTEKLIKEKLAELRAAGEPTTFEDLAKRFPDPPPEEDAAQLFANAFAIATNNFRPTGVPVVDSSIANTAAIEPSVLSRLVAFCQSTAALTNVIPREMPAHTRFPPCWRLGITNSGGMNFLAVRLLAQMITAQMVVAAEIGDTEAATRWIEKGFRFSRTISKEASLVQHMIRSAVDGLLCGGVERALTRTRFTDQQLQRIAASVPADDPNAIRECFRVERCVVIWAFDLARHGVDEGVLFYGTRRPWWGRSWDRIRYGPAYTEEDHLRCLRLSPAEIKSFDDPVKVQNEVNAMGAELRRTANSTLGKAISPNFTKAVTAQFDNRAKLVAMKAALEVERYRLANSGALPTSPLPPDPVVGQRLHLKALPVGFMVYSVGADGIDNSGVTRTNSNVQTNYDITFSIER